MSFLRPFPFCMKPPILRLTCSVQGGCDILAMKQAEPCTPMFACAELRQHRMILQAGWGMSGTQVPGHNAASSMCSSGHPWLPSLASCPGCAADPDLRRKPEWGLPSHFLAWKQRPLTFKGDSATLSLALFLAKEISFSESSFSLAISLDERMRGKKGDCTSFPNDGFAQPSIMTKGTLNPRIQLLSAHEKGNPCCGLYFFFSRSN